jgi:lysozyme
MRASAACIGLIKRFEGFSSTAYYCPAGYLTIGYGHVLNAENTMGTISESEAEILLMQDIRYAERAMGRLIVTPLTQGQHDALVSFTFNLGAGALQRSTLRRKINAGLHEEIPTELMRWVYAGGKKLAGLVRRRQAEANLYMA